jgi:hypothetical protein
MFDSVSGGTRVGLISLHGGIPLEFKRSSRCKLLEPDLVRVSYSRLAVLR